MLIRLMGHFLMNPQHIDKLIAIKGLPDDWMFKTRPDGQKELKAPWEADNDSNIPKQIRHVCEPIEVVKYFSPIEKGKEGVTDKMTILGVKLNFMTEPGREMWTKVVRYMDASVPRDQKLPEPVLVAKDQKSPFETYMPLRRVTGGIELQPADVPEVDLNAPLPPERDLPPVVVPVVPPPPVVVAETAVDPFKCQHCDYESNKAQAVRMHTTKRHPKKERVGV